MRTKQKHRLSLDILKKDPLLAEVKVSYRTKAKSKIKITSSKDAFRVIFPLFNRDTIEFQEEFYLLLLNNANVVLGWIKLSKGGTKAAIVDPKVIFVIAFQTNSSGIILCHNHPSGNISPSQSDRDANSGYIDHLKPV